MKEQSSDEIIAKLKRELHEKQEELDRLNSMKGRLFSIVSHDIKSPIGIVTGFAEVLMNHVSESYDVKDDPQFEVIKKHLNDGKDRLLTLLEDLINWVKCENGSMPFRPSDQEAKPLIESTVKLLTPYALDKSIHIDIEIDENLSLFGDSNTLKVIFKNLLNNAIKYTKNDGTVSIKGIKQNDAAEITIIDTGMGIPDSIIENIYKATKDKIRPGTGGESGIGLGLVVVKGFVELNQGLIRVNSNEEKGTSFKLSLPLKK